MEVNTLARSREAESFLDALQEIPPEVISACDGWTTHEITAHLAATAAEVTRHLEAYLEGRPIPATASFEQREPPYRALPDPALRQRLEVEEATMRSTIAQALDRDPDAVIAWTGRQMAVAKFVPHLRNEFAIHRWDIAGDDQVSRELLGQPDLTDHAVTVLGRILVARGLSHDPGAGQDFAVRLRAEGAPDLRLTVTSGPSAPAAPAGPAGPQVGPAAPADRAGLAGPAGPAGLAGPAALAGPRAGLELVEGESDEPYLELDAAARTLVIWGRRPTPPNRMRSHLDPFALARLQALLAGY
jgi:hypothetical protein